MNAQSMKMISNDIAPKKLTQKYNYNKACEDIEQINGLLNKEVFKIIEINSVRMYCRDIEFLYNEYYEHLTTDSVEIPKIKKEFRKIISRYYNYLHDYYLELYGEDAVINIGMAYTTHTYDKSLYCDCCVKMWSKCQCWCGNCGDDYRTCKYKCLTNSNG